MNTQDFNPPFDRFEFGVCLRDKGEREYFQVPIKPEVEVVFQEALAETVRLLAAESDSTLDSLKEWEAAEKHSTNDPCYIDLNSDFLRIIRELIDGVDNFETSHSVLEDNPEDVFFYFCRFKKGQNEFWGLRRATQFKSNLKTKNVFFGGGELHLAKERVFRLDNFFDAIIAAEKVFILRPNDFEYLADLEFEMQTAAVSRLKKANEALPFFRLDNLISLVEEDCSIQRARLATAVASRDDLAQTDRELFRKACERVDIELNEIDGQFEADAKNSWAVLTLLDRRRYATNLVPEQNEIYEAGSRAKIEG